MTFAEEAFRALSGGHEPLRWQVRLLRAFERGEVPRQLALPTGLGKTSVIPIWLIALAGGGSNSLRKDLAA